MVFDFHKGLVVKGLGVTEVHEILSKGVIVTNSFLFLTSSPVSGLPPWPHAFLEVLFLLGKRTER